MDDFIYVVMFILFVVAPILERVRKGQRGGPTEPRRRERTAEVGNGHEEPRIEVPADATSRGSAQEAEEATSVIPDDLWELLTGERRQSASRPAPEEATYESQDVEPSHTESYDEDAIAVAERGYDDARDAEPGPVLVPAEPEPLAAGQFERWRPARVAPRRDPRLATPADPIPAPRPRQRAPLALKDMDDLRRAVVLREVLGPPRGLE
ncbi:MAG TPA: hypothetical protein VNZ57_03690 [Longimicrobiales bacterium]|nr:hypothetical protein [Longimicrobiales bacterium]